MKEVFVRPDRCLGCRSCQLACAVAKSKSKTLFGAVTETPGPRYRLYVEQSGGLKVPLTCRHCDPAPCLEACIAGCLYRDELGLVRRQKDHCVACWTCIMVCPYGVISRGVEPKIAVKCDRCHKLEVPACVQACPTGALVFAEADRFTAIIRKSAAEALARAAE
jgi:carbon-monoxide dehydrogenase iron sulfur subunit